MIKRIIKRFKFNDNSFASHLQALHLHNIRRTNALSNFFANHCPIIEETVSEPQLMMIEPPEMKKVRLSQKWLQKRNYIIIDAREKHDIQTLKLDGNDWINIPKEDICLMSDIEDFVDECTRTMSVEQLIMSDIENIFIFCRSGGQSTHAVAHLTDIGVENVYNIVGGMIAWRMGRQSIYQNISFGSRTGVKKYCNIFSSNFSEEINMNDAMADNTKVYNV